MLKEILGARGWTSFYLKSKAMEEGIKVLVVGFTDGEVEEKLGDGIISRRGCWIIGEV